MGFNTTVLILNDQLSDIEREPEKFVRELVRAIAEGKFPTTIFPGQATVVECHHADYDVCVRVGGNRAEIVPDRGTKG